MDNNKTNLIRRDIIIGSKRFSNYFWSVLLLLGGLGFLLAGFSSYLKISLLPFANPTELVFKFIYSFNYYLGCGEWLQ